MKVIFVIFVSFCERELEVKNQNGIRKLEVRSGSRRGGEGGQEMTSLLN